MATSQFTELSSVPIPARRMFLWSWAGIFAGTFVFLAIEATFGVLGTAIFSSASNPNAAVPTTPNMGLSLQIWMIILSIIALYFAGKTSSKLLYGAADRNLGMYHGLVTFGMSIFATILIVALAANGGTVVYTGTAAAPMRALGIGGYLTSGGEWWLFVALVLAFIAAAAGGMHGVRNADLLPDRSVTAKRVA